MIADPKDRPCLCGSTQWGDWKPAKHREAMVVRVCKACAMSQLKPRSARKVRR